MPHAVKWSAIEGVASDAPHARSRRWLPYADCGLDPTEHVSRDWRVIGEMPRRCVWSRLTEAMRSRRVGDPRAALHTGGALWIGWGWLISPRDF